MTRIDSLHADWTESVHVTRTTFRFVWTIGAAAGSCSLSRAMFGAFAGDDHHPGRQAVGEDDGARRPLRLRRGQEGERVQAAPDREAAGAVPTVCRLFADGGNPELKLQERPWGMGLRTMTGTDARFASNSCLCPMLDDRTVTRTGGNRPVGEHVWTRDANAYGWTVRLGHAPGLASSAPYTVVARMNDLKKPATSVCRHRLAGLVSGRKRGQWDADAGCRCPGRSERVPGRHPWVHRVGSEFLNYPGISIR